MRPHANRRLFVLYRVPQRKRLPWYSLRNFAKYWPIFILAHLCTAMWNINVRKTSKRSSSLTKVINGIYHVWIEVNRCRKCIQIYSNIFGGCLPAILFLLGQILKQSKIYKWQGFILDKLAASFWHEYNDDNAAVDQYDGCTLWLV